MPTKSQFKEAMIEELNSRGIPGWMRLHYEYLEVLDSALSRLPDLPDEKPLCPNLDGNNECINMCLTRCIEGGKFWKDEKPSGEYYAMTKKDIIDAYCRIRTIDNTIPDEVLDYMKNSSIACLESNPSHPSGECYVPVPVKGEGGRLPDESAFYYTSNGFSCFENGKWISDVIRRIPLDDRIVWWLEKRTFPANVPTDEEIEK